jgi:adenosyl cobinamide kinase/adenosyl cobinamide phosphate guanylyltransferase
MLIFIFGKPKSGKSLFAEKILSEKEGKTLYIGTLQPKNIYKDIIKNHQIRRPPSWNLIELIGDLKQDKILIEKSLLTYDNFLIDGLSFYIIGLAIIMNNTENKIYKFTKIFASDISDKNNCIVIVDSMISIFLPKYLRNILKNVHLLIINNSDKIFYVDNNELRSLRKSDALSFYK